MSVKLPPEHHLEFLSLKGGGTGSSEYTLVKMQHCCKSHVVAQMTFKEISRFSLTTPLVKSIKHTVLHYDQKTVTYLFLLFSKDQNTIEKT